MRHYVTEQLVVHMARGEHLLDHSGDGLNVAPVRRAFGGRQGCKVSDVTGSNNDDRVATSDGVPLEMPVTGFSDIERRTELLPAKPAVHASFPSVPILRPRSGHRCFQQ